MVGQREGVPSEAQRFLKKAVEKGGEQLVDKFSQGDKGRTGHKDDSTNDMRRIRDRIVDFISEKIGDVNWRSEKDIKVFCDALEAFVNTQDIRFIRALSRISNEPNKRWVEFLQWIRERRLGTKKEVLDIIKQADDRIREAELEAMKAAQKKPVESGEPTQARDFAVETTPVSGVEINPDEILLNTKGDAANIGLPKEAVQTFDDLSVGIYIGDKVDSAVALKELLIQFGKQQQDLEDALEMMGDLMKEGVTPERMEEAQAQVAASEAKIKELQQIIDALTFDNKERGKREEQLTRDVFLLREENRTLLNNLEETNDVLQQQQGASSEVERLSQAVVNTNGFLETARKKVFELEQRLEETQTEKENAILDFSEIKQKIKAEIDKLEETREKLDGSFLDRMSWIADAREKMVAGFAERKLVAGDEERVVLETAESRLSAEVQKQESEARRIGQIITKIQEEIGRLNAMLDALESGGLQKDITGDISVAEELPDFEKMMSNAFSSVGQESVLSETKSEKIVVRDLPFSVEFTEEERVVIKELEDALKNYKGKSIDEIRQRVSAPVDLKETQKEFYEELLADLKNGKFADSLKRVIVLLGAMRDGNEFSARRSFTIGLLCQSHEVGEIRGPTEIQLLSHPLLQASILGKIFPDLNMVRRYQVGAKKQASEKLPKGPAPVNELTPLGELASQVWTHELLSNAKSEKERIQIIKKLSALHKNAQGLK